MSDKKVRKCWLTRWICKRLRSGRASCVRCRRCASRAQPRTTSSKQKCSEKSLLLKSMFFCIFWSNSTKMFWKEFNAHINAFLSLVIKQKKFWKMLISKQFSFFKTTQKVLKSVKDTVKWPIFLLKKPIAIFFFVFFHNNCARTA